MRIKTVGLVIAGAAVVAGAAGGVAWASGSADTEPRVRIVQQEQPAPDQPVQQQPTQQQPAPGRDCPDKGGQSPAPAESPAETL
jgi:hypothetical protein